MYTLAAGAGGAAIVGYFAGGEGAREGKPARGAATGSAELPAIKAGLELRRQGDDVVFRAPDGTLCAVNQAGATIVRSLDGRHTVATIADRLARDLELKRTQRLEAQVAEFVAELGIVGFLQRPFWAQIVYHNETTA